MPTSPVFWIIAFTAPIPIVHLFLHAFLPFWRRIPWLFYAFSAAVWAVAIALAWQADRIVEPWFEVPLWLVYVSEWVYILSAVLVVWSILTLGVRRFFLWAVLRPSQVEQKYIKAGPYKFLPHPAYTAYLFFALAGLLSTGSMVMFVYLLYLILFTLLLIQAEAREMKSRLGV